MIGVPMTETVTLTVDFAARLDMDTRRSVVDDLDAYISERCHEFAPAPSNYPGVLRISRPYPMGTPFSEEVTRICSIVHDFGTRDHADVGVIPTLAIRVGITARNEAAAERRSEDHPAFSILCDLVYQAN